MIMKLYKPNLTDLWFREMMLADPATMSYNNAWGGTIPFPRDKWQPWHSRWVANPQGQRFYRYAALDGGTFVGEVAYHYDADLAIYLADVIIYAPHRGQGYGRQALGLLCDAARRNGLPALHDTIAPGNPAMDMFLHAGFHEEYRTQEYIMLKLSLTANGTTAPV